MRVDAAQRRSMGFETKRPVANHLAAVVASSAHVRDGLDWQRFSAACFPGRRRHDLEALTAYAAYRRSRAVDARSSDELAQVEAALGPAGSTALQDWEDEGGAAPSVLAKALGLGTPERFPHERSD